MEKNLRETIKEIVKKHLKSKKGKVFGQCLTAVGWVGGTLPELYEKDGMVEVSMADVADGGFVVGAALMKSRPIYVIRYQGFNWYNCPMIINYACKSKEIWKISCPIFIRSIAMEGGVGPVAGSSHHSLYYRMPGIKIVSPMTPKEFKSVYKSFMKDDSVYYVSEHRGSYDNRLEIKNVMARIKNVGNLGRSMYDSELGNWSMDDLIKLASEQTGLSVDYIESWRNKPIYQNIEPEIDSFIFPLKQNPGKLLHKSGVWFKIANWKGNGKDIPFTGQTRRGRMTPDFKIAPFFEHVVANEGEY